MPVVFTESIADGQSLRSGLLSRTSAVGRSWILFMINLPLLAEVIRKYVHQQDSIFIGMAMILLLTILVLLFMPKTRVLKSLPLGIWLTILAFYSWAFANEVVASRSFFVFLIGLGTTFIPVAYMLVSSIYFQQGEGAIYRVFLCVNCWLALSLAVALLQIYLGIDHPFTKYGLGSTGIGDYTVGARSVEGLFRPTSIFTHTGKFGQAVFCLVLFKWCYLVLTKKPTTWFWKISICMDVLTVVVSGQRAAFLFLCISMGLLLLYRASRKGGRALALLFGYSLMGIVAIAMLSLLPILTSSTSMNLVFDRMLSSVYDISDRLMGNFILPFSTVVDWYLIFGEGLGRFTSGAAKYGGLLVYEIADLPGAGENSWIRMIAEVGVIGTILYLMILFQLLCLALRSVVSRRRQENEVVAYFFAFWLGSIMLWANTHDVFGNMIVTSLAFALGGGVLHMKKYHEGS
jgi:hypothetical protein